LIGLPKIQGLGSPGSGVVRDVRVTGG
jgi:hypothetical protein